MYLIELIVKKITQINQLTHKKEKPFTETSSDGDIFYDEKHGYENCEHTFMPIDSTNETLACTKCGLLVKRSELLKNKNFFMQDKPDKDLE